MEQKTHRHKRRATAPPRSEDALAELAVGYLRRFPCTEARLRRYLGEKLGESGDGGAWIDAVVRRMERACLLDDRAWAEGRARILLARGKARRVIERDLLRRGVPRELTRQAIAELAEENPALDLVAACNYARRRRLGPWAPEAERAAKRPKHLASLARAGFGFALARQIVDAADIAELEEALVDDGR